MKHGPRTILLKLLTILLSGSPYQWWTRQQVTAGLIPQQSQLKKSTSHVRHLFRAISVRTVELAGTNQFQMFAMVNIRKGGLKVDRVRSQTIRPLTKFPRGIYGHGRANYINGPLVAGASSLPAKSDQVISSGSEGSTLPQRAPGPGLKQQASSSERFKHQATSVKPQAASFKLQATSSKLRDT